MSHLARISSTALAAIATTGLMCAAAFAQSTMPMDVPTSIDGVTSVCTGVGYSEEHNPRWAAYPLKIILSGKHGQYLAGADFTITRKGKTVMGAHCDAPWLLVKLTPGRYRVTATRNGTTAASFAYAPDSGQNRAILRFPHEGGVVSNQYLRSLG